MQAQWGEQAEAVRSFGCRVLKARRPGLSYLVFIQGKRAGSQAAGPGGHFSDTREAAEEEAQQGGHSWACWVAAGGWLQCRRGQMGALSASWAGRLSGGLTDHRAGLRG